LLRAAAPALLTSVDILQLPPERVPPAFASRRATLAFRGPTLAFLGFWAPEKPGKANKSQGKPML